MSFLRRGFLVLGICVFILLTMQFKTLFPGKYNMQTSNLSGVARIDIIIPWSGIPKTLVWQTGTDLRRDRENGELLYLLRSIAKNAPWVRKVWILVNGKNLPAKPLEIPMSIKKRTTILDRCTFMPKGTCPTRNGFAVSAFAHRIPDLAEQFIMAEDDIFLGRPVTPSHFFEKGKPFVWRKKATWGFFGGQDFHPVYEDSSVVNFSTPKSSWPNPHYWYPLLKSVCKSMEEQYPEFYAFVGSHTEGRYSSLARKSSDKHNSQEEDFVGWMNWELLRTGEGVYKNIDNEKYEWWDEFEISPTGFQRAIQDRPIFMNVNDRFSKDAANYKKEIGYFHSAMESMFPRVKDKVIVGIGIPKCGTNKLDQMVSDSFGLVPCNDQWVNFKKNTARDSIYCSWGKTIASKKVREDVIKRLGTECNYLGTHQDLSISHSLSSFNVSYVTMLRDPIDRLVSGCNYSLGKNCTWRSIVKFARLDRGYGMPNRMTKMIAGMDPVCSLEPKKVLRHYATNTAALLQRAKENLRQKFIFVGILERMPESLAQLPGSSTHNVVLPRRPSSGGVFQGERKNLVKKLGPYVQLDQQLYAYANKLLDSRSPCQPDQRFNTSDWYKLYATRVRSVQERPSCIDCVSDIASTKDNCARWWHPTPQRPYRDYLARSRVPRPMDQKINKCAFGQNFRPSSHCTASYEYFFQVLDNMRVIYFPRSETERGIVLNSSYLSSDRTIDLYVDMPHKMLHEKLKVYLEPDPHISGDDNAAEVTWNPPDCPSVRMVDSDWVGAELQSPAKPEDLCSCLMNSVELLCHKEGPKRMLTQYGPSWKLPIRVKLLDTPYRAQTHRSDPWAKDLISKLRTMVNPITGRIEAENVRAVLTETSAEIEELIPLILAQLNVMAATLGIYDQKYDGA